MVEGACRLDGEQVGEGGLLRAGHVRKLLQRVRQRHRLHRVPYRLLPRARRPPTPTQPSSPSLTNPTTLRGAHFGPVPDDKSDYSQYYPRSRGTAAGVVYILYFSPAQQGARGAALASHAQRLGHAQRRKGWGNG